MNERPETADDLLDVPETFRAGVGPDQFAAEVEVSEGSGTVAVTGEVDVLTAPLLWERLSEAIDSTQGQVVIDLSGVRFMDSMGLGTLVRAHKRLCENDRTMVVQAPDDRVRKLLTLTGLDGVFTIT